VSEEMKQEVRKKSSKAPKEPTQKPVETSVKRTDGKTLRKMPSGATALV